MTGTKKGLSALSECRQTISKGCFRGHSPLSEIVSPGFAGRAGHCVAMHSTHFRWPGAKLPSENARSP